MDYASIATYGFRMKKCTKMEITFVHQQKRGEKMSDLISRQALCDDLREYKVHPAPISSDESEVKGYNDGIDLAISVIAEFPSAEPEERKAKIEMNWATYFDNIGTAVIHIPYSYKCGNCGCQLQRTYDGIDINYCPECGYRLEWK